MNPKRPLSPFEAQRQAAQRAALNALKRARRAAEKAGVSLSEWEGDFLNSVGDRVKTYGRAFGDPEKGAPRAGPVVDAGPQAQGNHRQGQGRGA